jgi:glycosyltransferase involved in cell wall biosynthesis
MIESMPLISIVITTYKRTERLKQAIESALKQTYENVEILVIDDNVNDTEYRSFVENLMINYPKVRYIKNKINLGGSLARNVGIDASKGEFIAFLDDDDLYESSKIYKQYKCYIAHKEQNVGMIYCYSSQTDSDRRIIGAYKNDFEGNPIYQHMLECVAGTSLWFCPKKVLIDVGKFEDTPSKQDSIMLLKILALGYNVFRVPEILVNYTEHNEGRISGMQLSNIEGICNFREWCRKYYKFIGEHERKNVEYNFSKILIPLYLYNQKKSEAIKMLKVMVKINIFKKNTIIALLKCLFPSAYLRQLNK